MTLGGNSTRYELKHLQELHSENRELTIQLRELVDRANTGIEELKWRVDRNEHAISAQVNKLDKDIWEFHQDFLFDGANQCNYLYDYVVYDTENKGQVISKPSLIQSPADSPQQRFKENPCKRRSDQPDLIPDKWKPEPIPEFPRPNSTTTTMVTDTTQTSSAGITSYNHTLLSYSTKFNNNYNGNCYNTNIFSGYYIL